MNQAKALSNRLRITRRLIQLADQDPVSAMGRPRPEGRSRPTRDCTERTRRS
jgi:hypothetical protein